MIFTNRERKIISIIFIIPLYDFIYTVLLKPNIFRETIKIRAATGLKISVLPIKYNETRKIGRCPPPCPCSTDCGRKSLKKRWTSREDGDGKKGDDRSALETYRFRLCVPGHSDGDSRGRPALHPI